MCICVLVACRMKQSDNRKSCKTDYCINKTEISVDNLDALKKLSKFVIAICKKESKLQLLFPIIFLCKSIHFKR